MKDLLWEEGLGDWLLDKELIACFSEKFEN